MRFIFFHSHVSGNLSTQGYWSNRRAMGRASWGGVPAPPISFQIHVVVLHQEANGFHGGPWRHKQWLIHRDFSANISIFITNRIPKKIPSRPFSMKKEIRKQPGGRDELEDLQYLR
jgi:hypothetical protein